MRIHQPTRVSPHFSAGRGSVPDNLSFMNPDGTVWYGKKPTNPAISHKGSRVHEKCKVARAESTGCSKTALRTDWSDPGLRRQPCARDAPPESQSNLFGRQTAVRTAARTVRRPCGPSGRDRTPLGPCEVRKPKGEREGQARTYSIFSRGWVAGSVFFSLAEASLEAGARRGGFSPR